MDPWDMQKQLMIASNQEVASTYVMNNTSLLYAALILEEVSELMESISNVLTVGVKDQTISAHFRNVSQVNDEISKEIRQEISTRLNTQIYLSKAHLIDIVDASTDIAVVNAGFAVSTGFNGADCYMNVAESNLSKVNPVTGIIDKDNSGKWIKGVNYKEPNLQMVLFK